MSIGAEEAAKERGHLPATKAAGVKYDKDETIDITHSFSFDIRYLYYNLINLISYISFTIFYHEFFHIQCSNLISKSFIHEEIVSNFFDSTIKNCYMRFLF